MRKKGGTVLLVDEAIYLQICKVKPPNSDHFLRGSFVNVDRELEKLEFKNAFINYACPIVVIRMVS